MTDRLFLGKPRLSALLNLAVDEAGIRTKSKAEVPPIKEHTNVNVTSPTSSESSTGPNFAAAAAAVAAGLQFNNSRPPGSVALPGIHGVAARAAAVNASGTHLCSPTTVNGKLPRPFASTTTVPKDAESMNLGARNPPGVGIYSPEPPPPQGLLTTTSTKLNASSPMDHPGMMFGMPDGANGYAVPPPPSTAAPTLVRKPERDRPTTLGSVIGVNGGSASTSGKSTVNGGGKRTRWLLCYPAGGAASSSESPSPPSEEIDSNASTPSPTDHGFKIPNSQSNERPTSLPVALLNSSRMNGKKNNAFEALHFDIIYFHYYFFRKIA